METTSVVHRQKKLLEEGKKIYFPLFAIIYKTKGEKPEVLESVAFVQHIFMHTISFTEKQGLLFLNTPRDIRHRKDAWRKIQRVGTLFHACLALGLLSCWDLCHWCHRSEMRSLTNSCCQRLQWKWWWWLEFWEFASSTSQAVWCFLKCKITQNYTQKKMLFLLHNIK